MADKLHRPLCSSHALRRWVSLLLGSWSTQPCWTGRECRRCCSFFIRRPLSLMTAVLAGPGWEQLQLLNNKTGTVQKTGLQQGRGVNSYTKTYSEVNAALFPWIPSFCKDGVPAFTHSCVVPACRHQEIHRNSSQPASTGNFSNVDQAEACNVTTGCNDILGNSLQAILVIAIPWMSPKGDKCLKSTHALLRVQRLRLPTSSPSFLPVRQDFCFVIASGCASG